MPVEAQARRPLARRDRRVIAAVALLGAGAVAAGAVAYAGHSSQPVESHCLTVTVASTMGGAAVRYCGDSARVFCAEQAPRSTAIAAECERQGWAAPTGSGLRTSRG
jgi:hypothetical protein